MLFAVRPKKRSAARIWQSNDHRREIVDRTQNARAEACEENSNYQGITKSGRKHMSPPGSGSRGLVGDIEPLAGIPPIAKEDEATTFFPKDNKIRAVIRAIRGSVRC